jgi:hypothetical protein
LGNTGYNGSTGVLGYTGSIGIGYTGSIGNGYTGSAGYSGSTGYAGSIGYSGSSGYSGSNGYSGSTGYVGSTGYTGSIGYTGSFGYIGSIGYTGSAGYSGSTGFVGSIGIGYTGSVGPSSITAINNQQNTGTGYIMVPNGTTAERPVSPYYGAMRYNTTTGFAEVYTSGGWSIIGAAPPTITTVSPSTYNGESGTTFTINGTGFTSDAIVKFIDVNNTEFTASVVSFVNSTQLTATTPQDFTVAQEPLDVRVSQLSGIVTKLDCIDCGGSPSWTTTAGQIGGTIYSNGAVSTSVAATDPDSGATITYSVYSGALPSGLSLNNSTGAITGTAPSPGSDTTYNFTIRVTDNAGNTADRAFSIVVLVPAPSSVEYLVLAGGAGGGNNHAGGGGAGGYYNSTVAVAASTAYTVTIGGGGGGARGGFPSIQGTSGSASQFASISATGGGGGGGREGGGGLSGGSGGGGGGGSGADLNYGSSVGGGYRGGAAVNLYGGGGGGAGGAATDRTGYLPSDGGVAAYSSITGTSTPYGGGGGGGGYGAGTYGVGGSGLGGTGGNGGDATSAPSANTGSGGGGGKPAYGGGGSGSSGVVIIAYPTSYKPLASIGGGLSYTIDTSTRSGYRVYRFTAGTGTISW